MSDRRPSHVIGDAMPKKGKVSEVCKEFTVYEDGALALRLQDEEISNHYSGNRMRNAIVRSDFPCAKQQQTQEQMKAQHLQDLLNQQAALDATLAAKIQDELIQREQKKLSKLKIRDEQMAQQIMVGSLSPHTVTQKPRTCLLEEQRSHPNTSTSPSLPNNIRQTPHQQPEPGPRSPLRQPQSPIYQNIQNQWSPSRVALPDTSPNYKNVEPPWSQTRVSPQTPSPSYKVDMSAWSPARTVSQGQVPSQQVNPDQWPPRQETTRPGPESRLSPVRAAQQRSSPEHRQYSPSRAQYSPSHTGVPPSHTGAPPSLIGTPPLSPTGLPSPQQRMSSPLREHPPRTPPKYVSPPSSHSSPESRNNSRSGDSPYLQPAAPLCVDLGIPLIEEEEERKRQEEKDADLAARLQAEEDKDTGTSEMRDALIAIEQQDRELAHMLQQQEKARYKRAREKAKLKKKQKEAESQQSSEDKSVDAAVEVDVGEPEEVRTDNPHYDHRNTKLKSPDILESTPSRSSSSTPSKLSNSSKPAAAHVSNIAKMIDPTYHHDSTYSDSTYHGSSDSTYQHSSDSTYGEVLESPPPTPTTDAVSPLSHRMLYEDDGPVPPYMPIQGHKRNELLEKKKRRREKESCKQQ